MPSSFSLYPQWIENPVTGKSFSIMYSVCLTHLGSELFGCPLIASIPSYVTGYHLYRCIGYLLPNALPMKDKTSFTLHTVNSSGQSCSSCSLESCKGCLIRIDDNIRIKPDTNFVVHFDDLAEESKKNFGISNARGISDANSQGISLMLCHISL